ncbi:MAG: 3-oxoacid CoA-transferase subunit A [Betaproteobacteria bacterium]|nr:3-oxoacid CoA-transferase subunit A [Betaproteobacteria bacterium]MBI2959449.1 3-oxoacid CoA-transferase subunit A [Betaproteobacteria bacterium]
MIDKTVASCREAVASVCDGATIMMAGFGGTGVPGQLAEALREQGAANLTVIHNGGGDDDNGLGGLMLDGRVRKLIASFPNSPRAWAFRDRYLKGEIELELVPQGSLVERIRAGGVGLGGIYTPTGVGTPLAAGKEIREIDGRQYLFEKPLRADFAFIRAHQGDRLGNLRYRFVMRNFNMIMATAAKTVIAEVDQIVPVGTLSPEEIHTPGIYVDRLVQVERLSGKAKRPPEGSA